MPSGPPTFLFKQTPPRRKMLGPLTLQHPVTQASGLSSAPLHLGQPHLCFSLTGSAISPPILYSKCYNPQSQFTLTSTRSQAPPQPLLLPTSYFSITILILAPKFYSKPKHQYRVLSLLSYP